MLLLLSACATNLAPVDEVLVGRGTSSNRVEISISVDRRVNKNQSVKKPGEFKPDAQMPESSSSSDALVSDPSQLFAALKPDVGDLESKLVNEPWVWPVRAKVMQHFDFDKGTKGIDFSVLSEQPVLASRSGEVLFAGRGVRGYGQLIIIKHDALYVSAYGGNDKVFVKEGETVNAGQKVGVKGLASSKNNVLHFVIWFSGKAIDPLSLLKN